MPPGDAPRLALPGSWLLVSTSMLIGCSREPTKATDGQSDVEVQAPSSGDDVPGEFSTDAAAIDHAGAIGIATAASRRLRGSGPLEASSHATDQGPWVLIETLPATPGGHLGVHVSSQGEILDVFPGR